MPPDAKKQNAEEKKKHVRFDIPVNDGESLDSSGNTDDDVTASPQEYPEKVSARFKNALPPGCHGKPCKYMVFYGGDDVAAALEQIDYDHNKVTMVVNVSQADETVTVAIIGKLYVSPPSNNDQPRDDEDASRIDAMDAIHQLNQVVQHEADIEAGLDVGMSDGDEATA